MPISITDKNVYPVVANGCSLKQFDLLRKRQRTKYYVRDRQEHVGVGTTDMSDKGRDSKYLLLLEVGFSVHLSVCTGLNSSAGVIIRERRVWRSGDVCRVEQCMGLNGGAVTAKGMTCLTQLPNNTEEKG